MGIRSCALVVGTMLFAACGSGARERALAEQDCCANQWGDTVVVGDLDPGDPATGDALPGDPGGDTPHGGDPGAGDPSFGDPNSPPGDPRLGDPNPGDPAPGGDPGGTWQPARYRCVTSLGDCVEYVGIDHQEAVVQVACEGNRGTFAVGVECSTLNLSGICYDQEGTGSEVRRYIYGFSCDFAGAACLGRFECRQ